MKVEMSIGLRTRGVQNTDRFNFILLVISFDLCLETTESW